MPSFSLRPAITVLGACLLVSLPATPAFADEAPTDAASPIIPNNTANTVVNADAAVAAGTVVETALPSNFFTATPVDALFNDINRQVGQQVADANAQLKAATEQFNAQFGTQVVAPSIQAPVLPVAEPAKLNGPDYTWTTDPHAQLMAMKPGAVLHRVEGSMFHAPDIPQESLDAEAQGYSLYGPGTPIYVGEKGFCTLAFAGYDAAGNKVGVTAAHCGQVGEKVLSADSYNLGPSGQIVARVPEKDYALIRFDDNAKITGTYNGVHVSEVGGAPLAPGEVVAKHGVATGTTYGVSLSNAEGLNISQLCAMNGDSGAPLLQGSKVVGMVSGGLIPGAPCTTPWQGPLFSPTLSTRIDRVVADLDARQGIGAGFTPAA